MITLIIAIIYTCLSLYSIFVEYKKHFISPLCVFLIFQLIFFVGIYIYMDTSNSTDVKLLILYLIALIFIRIGCFARRSSQKKQSNCICMDVGVIETKTIRKRLNILIILSVLLCMWFFSSVGGNVFILALQMVLEGDMQNFSELRKLANYASGSGLIYQFRVYILPCAIYFLLFFCKGKSKIIGIIALPFALVYLVGTGQRAGLVNVMIVVFINTALVMKNNKRLTKKRLIDPRATRKSGRASVILLVLGIVVFLFLTIANGRDESSGGLISAVVDRIFHDNQYSAIYAFRYIDKQGVCYGYDGLMMLLNVIPGVDSIDAVASYTSVASLIHQEFYGSLTGTSPPCIWGSTYYNFGYVGVVIVAFLIGYFYEAYRNRVANRNNTPFDLLIYSMMVMTLGTWSADGFYTVIINGLMATLFIKYFVELGVKKKYVPYKRIETSSGNKTKNMEKEKLK